MEIDIYIKSIYKCLSEQRTEHYIHTYMFKHQFIQCVYVCVYNSSIYMFLSFTRPHAGLSNLQLDISIYASRKTRLKEPLYSIQYEAFFNPIN